MSTHRRTSERGAVIIQVAVCLLGLMAFSAFVVDYGVMWSSRGQAQTAADAGALSGALSLAFDSGTDFVGAKAKAQAIAKQNFVWGQAPDVLLTDITFPACPPGAPGVPDTCVKVDVFRNGTRANPLPMFFGNLVGVNSQGVRATATAQITTGDTTDCLRPWAIVDRWDEYNGAHAEPNFPTTVDPDWGPTATYDKYSTGQGNRPPQEDDLYVPPSDTSAGTGFQLPMDQGLQFAIKVGDNSNSISSGWFRGIDLPRADGQTGANGYRANIDSCNGLPSSYAAADTVCPASIGNADLAYWAARGCYAVETGNMIGPTAQGIAGLVAKDSGASWTGSGITGKIINSNFSPATKSPRVVPVGVMDIGNYMSQDPNGSTPVIRMVNLFGFFIEGMGDVAANGTITLSPSGKSVIGRIMTIPASGSSKLSSNASFLRNIILVR
jgi:hypothetical protein